MARQLRADCSCMNLDQLQSHATMASDLLKIMASRSRLLILCQLLDGEKSVQFLEAKLQMRQPALSQHLAILRRERFVHTRREAQFIYYALARDDFVSVLQALHSIYCKPVKPT